MAVTRMACVFRVYTVARMGSSPLGGGIMFISLPKEFNVYLSVSSCPGGCMSMKERRVQQRELGGGRAHGHYQSLGMPCVDWMCCAVVYCTDMFPFFFPFAT